MLEQMKLSLSEALNCGVEAGDVRLSRDDFNRCIKIVHPNCQIALPPTSTFTNPCDDSFSFLEWYLY